MRYECAIDVAAVKAIDMHVHIECSDHDHLSLPDALNEASAKYFKAEDRTPKLDTIAERYREWGMAAVVFTVDAETNLKHPPVSSEEIAEGAARNNDVLIPFGSVDPRQGAKAVEKAKRLVEECGVRGFKFHPSVQGFDPSDEQYYPLYEAVQALGVPALFHTGQNGMGAGLPGGYGIKLAYSNPLLLDAVAADFPELQVILAHPSVPWQDEANSILTHKSNVWVDLSGWSPKYFPESLVKGVNRMFSDRALFGTDYPLIEPAKWLGAFEQAAFTDEVRPKVLKDNAVRLLGLGADMALDIYATCDPYGISDRLTEAEAGVLRQLRSVLDAEVKPLVNEYWEAGEFPYQVLDPLKALNLMAPDAVGENPSQLYHGFRIFELARTDASIVTFYTAQAGLFRTACRVGGTPEQFAEWDPRIRSFEMTGVFSLTEPDHGSDIAGGLATTARRDGDAWVIDGAKRWIGGAFTADYLAVFARDEGDGQVKGFLVDREAEGITLEKIERKTALRMMQNAHITLSGVRVPESQRLGNVNSFKDVAAMLRVMRSDVAWIATGLQAGALEAALAYVKEREQFGRPIGHFQLVQEKLARMLGNLTASLTLVAALADKQQRGEFKDEDSALAKMWTSLHMRETVALAREVVGGNGITLDTDVARFHADAEAVYSYEGTHEINALVVGRGLTGKGAFV